MLRSESLAEPLCKRSQLNVQNYNRARFSALHYLEMQDITTDRN
jgi:hypothetical protein